MAGMLPPFVPPSARVSTEPLPLITEFVLDRGEQPVEQSFTVEQWEPPEPASFETEATLPSIDEFLLERPVENEIAPADTSPQMEDSTEAPFTAQSAVQAEEMPEPAAPELVDTPPAADEQATEEQAAPEQSAPVESDVEAVPLIGPEDVAHAAPEPAIEVGGESWVGDERDSFNWQGAATLATPADDEKRASEDWSSTNWERSGASSHDHVVALLGQIARRVRSGELHVEASQNMSAEAVLAAVLVALLSEPDGG